MYMYTYMYMYMDLYIQDTTPSHMTYGINTR